MDTDSARVNGDREDVANHPDEDFVGISSVSDTILGTSHPPNDGRNDENSHAHLADPAKAPKGKSSEVRRYQAMYIAQVALRINRSQTKRSKECAIQTWNMFTDLVCAKDITFPAPWLKAEHLLVEVSKTNIWSKWLEIKREVNNEITPAYYKVLDKSKSKPTGSTTESIFQDTRKVLYEQKLMASRERAARRVPLDLEGSQSLSRAGAGRSRLSAEMPENFFPLSWEVFVRYGVVSKNPSGVFNRKMSEGPTKSVALSDTDDECVETNEPKSYNRQSQRAKENAKSTKYAPSKQVCTPSRKDFLNLPGKENETTALLEETKKRNAILQEKTKEDKKRRLLDYYTVFADRFSSEEAEVVERVLKLDCRALVNELAQMANTPSTVSATQSPEERQSLSTEDSAKLLLYESPEVQLNRISPNTTTKK
jgi:hypothetical protein